MVSKSWCFTINNYTDEDVAKLNELTEVSNVLYAAYEQAPTTGTHHIQGYITLQRARRMPGVKKLFDNDSVHLEVARGGKAKNHDYIIKGLNTDGTPKDVSEPFIEHDCGSQGARSDLKEVIECARESGVKRAATDFPTTYAKFHKGIERVVALQRSSDIRTEPPTVYWLYGPTGVGKTHFAFEHTAPTRVYIADMWPQWFDGILDHDWLVLDELDKRDFRVWQLLKLTDRYPFEVPVKGSTVNFNVPNIVITSTAKPQDLISDPSDWAQVNRRLAYIGTKETLEADWQWEKMPSD